MNSFTSPHINHDSSAEKRLCRKRRVNEGNLNRTFKYSNTLRGYFEKTIKNKLLILFILIACNSNKSMQIFDKIEEVYVFQSFNKGGTTAMIKSAFFETKSKEQAKNKISKEHLVELNNFMQNKRSIKHKQQKIAGIEKGIEIYATNGCFYYILTQSKFIDISRNYEYELNKNEYIQLKNIFEF